MGSGVALKGRVRSDTGNLSSKSLSSKENSSSFGESVEFGTLPAMSVDGVNVLVN